MPTIQTIDATGKSPRRRQSRGGEKTRTRSAVGGRATSKAQVRFGSRRRSHTQKETPVFLRVYDISDGMASTWSTLLLGRKIEGVWHTGVQAFGYEYFYGGGIIKMHPEDVEETYGITPSRIHHLGSTNVPRYVFEKYLLSIVDSFTRECYDLTKWNCNNFTDHIAKFLVTKGIPPYVLELPDEITSTFMGKLIVNFLNAFRGDPPVGTEDPNHPRHNLRIETQSRPKRRFSSPPSPHGNCQKFSFHSRRRSSITLNSEAESLSSSSSSSSFHSSSRKHTNRSNRRRDSANTSNLWSSKVKSEQQQTRQRRFSAFPRSQSALIFTGDGDVPDAVVRTDSQRCLQRRRTLEVASFERSLRKESLRSSYGRTSRQHVRRQSSFASGCEVPQQFPRLPKTSLPDVQKSKPPHTSKNDNSKNDFFRKRRTRRAVTSPSTSAVRGGFVILRRQKASSPGR